MTAGQIILGAAGLLATALIVAASIIRCRCCGKWHESAEADHQCHCDHHQQANTKNHEH